MRAQADQEGLMNRDFTLTLAATFLFMLNFTSFYLLPFFIQGVGGTESDIGFIAGVGWITSFVCTPLSGTLVDRWGSKPVLLVGSALLGAASLGFLAVREVGPLVYGLRIFQGAGLALGLTGGYTLVAGLSPPSRRGEAYGAYMVFTLSPHAIGPWAGEAIVRAGGFPAFFVVVALYGALAVLLGLLIRFPALAPTSDSPSSLGGLLLRRDLWPVMGTVLLAGSSFGAILTFVPTYLKARGFETVGFFFVTYTIVAVLVRIFLSKLSDRWGRRRVIVPSLAVMVVVLSCLALADNRAWFVAAAFLFGIAQGFVQPALGALVVDRVVPGDRGRALGLFSGCFHFGIFLNSTLLGGVAEGYGYPAVYWVSAGIALGCTFFFAGFDASGKDRRGGVTTRPW